MKHSGKLAPVGALTAALLSIGCCLPFSIPAALGLAGLSMFASVNQVWLIGTSIVLLSVGAVQLLRNRSCGRSSRTSIVLLGAAAALIVAVTVFPQAIAAFLADRIR